MPGLVDSDERVNALAIGGMIRRRFSQALNTFACVTCETLGQTLPATPKRLSCYPTPQIFYDEDSKPLRPIRFPKGL